MFIYLFIYIFFHFGNFSGIFFFEAIIIYFLMAFLAQIALLFPLPLSSLFSLLLSSLFPLCFFLLPFSAFCNDLANICTAQFDCDLVTNVETMRCSMGLCVPSKCHLSSECPTGWACTSEMQCMRNCFSDGDCARIGWLCTAQNVCEQGDCGECRVGEECVEGQCMPRWVIRGMRHR